MALAAALNDNLIAILIPLVIVGGLFGQYWIRKQLHHWKVRKWSRAMGHVTYGSIEVHSAVRRVDYYVAYLDYTYTINNASFSGCAEKIFSKKDQADQFLETMHDKPIFVRSNPDKPEISTVLDEDQPGIWPA